MFEERSKPKTKEKKETNGCEIKLKRDSEGRVIGIKTKGKCTKEDKLLFVKENTGD